MVIGLYSVTTTVNDPETIRVCRDAHRPAATLADLQALRPRLQRQTAGGVARAGVAKTACPVACGARATEVTATISQTSSANGSSGMGCCLHCRVRLCSLVHQLTVLLIKARPGMNPRASGNSFQQPAHLSSSAKSEQSSRFFRADT